ncbi:helix-turn-helix domain-containing protein [Bacillus cereus]|uniref:helix-turn-helix domain-containing protein n=1 Tax=Bacillus cereus TaxID=1396 RepID=UPI00240612D4|nr:helix-turn-helix domain-containing protein [Bacillus cereus]MDF9504268.1 helix-turn-helix domain-containing protein [Bacillus cereus]MDF9597214.1 helix-turn-helix domain-containing protein [Bacillus cereus]MDF9609040.1 helix-turn-helix domain-containing protein [Bacillus cereus]MDF9660254.1 helix-turn-helix domain-containing protein [Bacillus cereus]
MLERLSELRKSKKWSLQDTADQLGIAKSTYAGYETGYRWPSLQSLSKIADLFDTSVDYILGRTDDAQSEDVIEIAELMKNPEKKFSIDGESLSTDEIIEFIAFVRSKRELKSKRIEELF